MTKTTAWDAGYVKSESILITISSNNTIGSYGGSCVSFVKARLGVDNSVWNNPQYVWAHTDFLSLRVLPSPTLGSIIITSEGKVGHMGIVIGINRGIIKVIESNYIPNTIGVRDINIDDNVIIGFLTLK